MTKRINYNLPAGALDRLATNKTIATRGDKLALLRQLSERAGSTVQAGTNRVTLAAIEADVRAAHKPAKKDSAPAGTGAPSNAKIRTEQAPSVPEKALERKIDEDISLKIEDGYLALYHTDDGLLFVFTPDQADQFGEALAELADDLRQDIAARAWSQSLLTTG